MDVLQILCVTDMLYIVLFLIASVVAQSTVTEPMTGLSLPTTITAYNQVMELRNSPGKCLGKKISFFYSWKVAAFGVYTSNVQGVDTRGVSIIFNMTPFSYMLSFGLGKLFDPLKSDHDDPKGH